MLQRIFIVRSNIMKDCREFLYQQYANGGLAIPDGSAFYDELHRSAFHHHQRKENE